MQFWIKVLEIMDAQMKVPRVYGFFHLVFFVLSIVAGIVLCRVYKNPDEKFVRKYLLVLSIGLILFEIYKQINFSFSYENGISFNYQWYAFPFQFCSTPMYVGLMAALFKKGKMHDVLCSYLASYALFAGLCVMLYPATVFRGTIGINVQTMVWHGSMITTALFLLGSGYVKAELKTVFKALPVFLSFVVVAIIMNEIAFRAGLLNVTGEKFSMFYISPYTTSTLPVYKSLQQVVPFPLCVIVYVVVFTAAAYLLVKLLSLFNIKRKVKEN